jgi:Bacterial PH domain
MQWHHVSVAKNGSTLRFRHSSAITVAAVIMMIAGLSIGSWQPYLLVLLLIPFGVAVWSWRAGTDVNKDAITVRAALGRRRLPWRDVAELHTDDRGRVEAVLASGNRVTLTAVPAKELRAVVEASGTQLNAQ